MTTIQQQDQQPGDAIAAHLATTVPGNAATEHHGLFRRGSSLGFWTVFVADANPARTAGVHNAALCTLYRSFVDVRPTAAVLGLLGPIDPSGDAT